MPLPRRRRSLRPCFRVPAALRPTVPRTASVTVVYPTHYSPLRSLLFLHDSAPLRAITLEATARLPGGGFFLRASDLEGAVDGFLDMFDALVLPDGRHLLLCDPRTGKKAEWFMIPKELLLFRKKRPDARDASAVKARGRERCRSAQERDLADGAPLEGVPSDISTRTGAPILQLTVSHSEHYLLRQWKSFFLAVGIVMAACTIGFTTLHFHLDDRTELRP